MNTHAADFVGTTLWRLDPERSKIEFHVPTMWGLATVKGRFTRFHGQLEGSGVELTVEADSIDTANERRDKHLRSADFLDVARHPYIRFAGVMDRDGIQGQLRVRGASLPLDVEATVRRDGDELEVEVEAVADQRRLGMTWNRLGLVGAPTTMIVTGRLVQDLSRSASQAA